MTLTRKRRLPRLYSHFYAALADRVERRCKWRVLMKCSLDAILRDTRRDPTRFEFAVDDYYASRVWPAFQRPRWFKGRKA